MTGSDQSIANGYLRVVQSSRNPPIRLPWLRRRRLRRPGRYDHDRDRRRRAPPHPVRPPRPRAHRVGVAGAAGDVVGDGGTGPSRGRCLRRLRRAAQARTDSPGHQLARRPTAYRRGGRGDGRRGGDGRLRPVGYAAGAGGVVRLRADRGQGAGGDARPGRAGGGGRAARRDGHRHGVRTERFDAAGEPRGGTGSVRGVHRGTPGGVRRRRVRRRHGARLPGHRVDDRAGAGVDEPARRAGRAARRGGRRRHHPPTAAAGTAGGHGAQRVGVVAGRAPALPDVHRRIGAQTSTVVAAQADGRTGLRPGTALVRAARVPARSVRPGDAGGDRHPTRPGPSGHHDHHGRGDDRRSRHGHRLRTARPAAPGRADPARRRRDLRHRGAVRAAFPGHRHLSGGPRLHRGPAFRRLHRLHDARRRLPAGRDTTGRRRSGTVAGVDRQQGEPALPGPGHPRCGRRHVDDHRRPDGRVRRGERLGQDDPRRDDRRPPGPPRAASNGTADSCRSGTSPGCGPGSLW